MSESLTLSRLRRQKLLSLLMGVQTSTASRKSGRALLSHREFWCWSVAVSLQRGKRPGRSRALLPFPLLGRQSGRSLPTGRVQLGEASCPSSSWLPLVTGREPAEFSALPGLETGAGSQRHEQDLPPGGCQWQCCCWKQSPPWRGRPLPVVHVIHSQCPGHLYQQPFAKCISTSDCSPCCCSRRGACLSAFLMLLLTALAALIALVAILGPPPRTPGAQACVTQTNRTGFLCNDRSSCIPASSVCDGVRACAHGEDEEEALCLGRNFLEVKELEPGLAGAVPQSLPGFLVAHCGDPASWIYSDQMCDGINNCGDCSDELSPVTTCPPCGPGWWRCPSAVFRYCSCIPRSLCRDHLQHCFDWSDEYSCPGP
ncbi:low-density lipoprotein receptor class A domain-containing protein 1 isoform X2 [Bos mutus]|uniref:low-density lipoprotein receptor class A domain-containing protein 1 isoform X2 n=1 Tax=Bos mutus TaxID=72004 RepID=UPI0038B5E02C